MILLIDAGNTNIKFTFFDEENNKFTDNFSINSVPLNMAELDNTNFKSVIKSSCTKVAIVSSVTPSNNKLLKDYIEGHGVKVFILDYENYDLVVKQDYNTTAKAGMDIICKAAFLAFNKQEGLVLDVGTATVVSYVNGLGYLDKVAITIGFNTIFTALNHKTELIPLYKPKKVDNCLGKNTEDAVLGGSFWGYLGLINSLIAKSKEETKAKLIYLTGGYSFLYKNIVNFKSNYDDNLLFKGMYCIYLRNINKFRE